MPKFLMPNRGFGMGRVAGPSRIPCASGFNFGSMGINRSASAIRKPRATRKSSTTTVRASASTFRRKAKAPPKPKTPKVKKRSVSHSVRQQTSVITRVNGPGTSRQVEDRVTVTTTRKVTTGTRQRKPKVTKQIQGVAAQSSVMGTPSCYTSAGSFQSSGGTFGGMMSYGHFH